ncbi:MAG: hypothetical protein GF411_12465 [Candidatus Lokiarchaeota archaeon]|nr:hypothetical protein [Candidatus Lokiarchaeota archaeon]
MTDAHKSPCVARQLMEGMKATCSQAILSTFGPYMNTELDTETCMKIASAFSGGINNTGNVCGAITGALMAIGLEFSNGTPMDPKVAEVSTKFLWEFKAMHGSILCRDLLQIDASEEMGLQAAFESGAFNKCMQIAQDVAELMKSYLE